MGLDMYLEEEINITNKKRMVTTIMYWRKANAIHKWFVDNTANGIDDCKRTYVSMEQLKELYEICKKVIKTKNTKLLPTEKGFFFGDTDYNEYYYADLKETVEKFEEILSKDNKHVSFYYLASW